MPEKIVRARLDDESRFALRLMVRMGMTESEGRAVIERLEAEVADLQRKLRRAWEGEEAALRECDEARVRARERPAVGAPEDESEADLYARIRAAYGSVLADAWRAEVAKVARERDELKTRLAHAEADAEQAIHNEAFNERMKTVAWLRARIAHLSLDSRTTMQALDALRAVADEVERGGHER